MVKYTVNVKDIESALVDLGGEAKAGEIKDKITNDYCGGNIPENYQDRRSFRETIQRKIEDYCPQSSNFDSSKREAKFERVSRSLYRIIVSDGKKDSPINLNEQQADFQRRVKESMADSQAARELRLKNAPKLPAKAKAVTEIYIRNPDVVAEVLRRANGFCERCDNPAPFIRKKDSSPYLEVHHIQQLADGGEDTVVNAMALCPNCHRELHFGSVSG